MDAWTLSVLLSDLMIRRIHQRDTVYSTSENNYVCFYKFQYGVFTNVIRRIVSYTVSFILFTNRDNSGDRVALVFLYLIQDPTETK